MAAKFVPWLPSQEQKKFHAEIAQDLLETTNIDPYFWKKVITTDESWVYGYDPEAKAQSSQWKLPKSQRLKKVQCIMGVMGPKFPTVSLQMSGRSLPSQCSIAPIKPVFFFVR
jgi:hypothetical protein